MESSPETSLSPEASRLIQATVEATRNALMAALHNAERMTHADPVAWLRREVALLAGQHAAKPPLGGPGEVMIFVRAEGCYPIQGVAGLPLERQAEEHVALNPGTLRVEDAAGRVIWSLQ